jgi:uncharacterized BrkB/YihY/UPF0761 family membrane protein
MLIQTFLSISNDVKEIFLFLDSFCKINFLKSTDNQFFLKISEGSSAIGPLGIQKAWSESSKYKFCSIFYCSLLLLFLLFIIIIMYWHYETNFFLKSKLQQVEKGLKKISHMRYWYFYWLHNHSIIICILFVFILYYFTYTVTQH